MTSELLWGGPWSVADALLGFFPSRDFDSMAAAGPGGPARTWRSAPRLMQIGVDHEKYAALGYCSRRTYSNSNGNPCIPVVGFEIQFAICPGFITPTIKF